MENCSQLLRYVKNSWWVKVIDRELAQMPSDRALIMRSMSRAGFFQGNKVYLMEDWDSYGNINGRAF